MQNVLIGYSFLEYGDPPMGVAFGSFIPTSEFRQFDQLSEPLGKDVRKWNVDECVTETNEKVRVEGSGILLEEHDLGDEGVVMQISCLGIAYPKYHEFFPHHVKAYEAKFPE